MLQARIVTTHPEPATQHVEIVPADAQHASDRTTARADFIGALLWLVVGCLIFIGSWRMDRLEAQDINPYTIPGLVPGLLGLAMILLAALMLLRAVRHGALQPAAAPVVRDHAYGRLAMVLALCLGFAFGLIGRGLPFWLAAATYVALTIIVLQFREFGADRSGRVRGIAQAVLIASAAGLVVTFLFEKIFLVQLP